MSQERRNIDPDELSATKAKEIAGEDAPEQPENVILDHEAWRRMWVEDNNVIFTVVGDTGDGKSYATLRMAEKIDPNFSIDQVAFDIIDFLRLVMDESLGRGSVIVLEEASVEAAAMDWHSKSNEVFRKVLDTWRHQNRMAIITLPNFKALEKGARRRTTGIVKMQEALAWKGYSQGKYYRSKYDNVSDKFTTPFPTLEGMERRFLRFDLPSKELREAYEEKKDGYTEELNKELLEELLEERGENEEDTPTTPTDIADDILKTGVDEYIGDNHGQKYIDRDLIAVDYGIGDRKAKKVKKSLKREVEADVV